MRNQRFAPFAVGFALLALIATPATAQDKSIVDLALETPELSTLVELVVKAELVETLDEGGPFTVFAPTNDAFEAAGIDPDALTPEEIAAVLFDHVSPGVFNSAFVATQSKLGERLPTLGGVTLGIGLDPITVNGLGVVAADIEASNGVVHLIDGVILDEGPSIADTAIATPALSTLVEAVVYADLVQTLDEGGPFTVFAPTNAAFEEAGLGDPTALPQEAVAAVLLDHVVQGNFTEQELRLLARTGGSLTTVGGLELTFGPTSFQKRSLQSFRFAARGVEVNGQGIALSNVSASNGVVHVITGVLLRDE